MSRIQIEFVGRRYEFFFFVLVFNFWFLFYLSESDDVVEDEQNSKWFFLLRLSSDDPRNPIFKWMLFYDAPISNGNTFGICSNELKSTCLNQFIFLVIDSFKFVFLVYPMGLNKKKEEQLLLLLLTTEVLRLMELATVRHLFYIQVLCCGPPARSRSSTPLQANKKPQVKNKKTRKKTKQVVE